MAQVQILRIVVASPSDVQPERNLLPQIIDELNRGVARERKLRLELFRWEIDAHPGFHAEGPQGVIDPILDIANCDLLIGIFWRRFGTPTLNGKTGTEHELMTAYKAWKKNGRPQIFVYFNQKSYTPKSRADTEQREKVIEFRDNKFPKEGLWWPYKGTVEFEKLVRIHLTNYILKLPTPKDGEHYHVRDEVVTLDPETDFEHRPHRRDLLTSILRDLHRHFQLRPHPLQSRYYQEKAIHECIEDLPGVRMNVPDIDMYSLGSRSAPELIWVGRPDSRSLNTLRSWESMHISVHAMMVSAIAALLLMKREFGINLSISCPSSTSVRHLLSLMEGEQMCDVLVTADAGVQTSELDITRTFQKSLIVWKEKELVLGKCQEVNHQQVIYVPGTTQDIHYEHASAVGRLPKDKLIVDNIEDLFDWCKYLGLGQLVLLTAPKSVRPLQELQLLELDHETHGMSFSLYIRKELPKELRIAFRGVFIAAYNRSRQRFESYEIDGIEYRRQVLKEMTGVPGFFYNYAFGTFAEIGFKDIR